MRFQIETDESATTVTKEHHMKSSISPRRERAAYHTYQTVHCFAGVPCDIYTMGAPFDTGYFHGPLLASQPPHSVNEGFARDRAEHVAYGLDD